MMTSCVRVLLLLLVPALAWGQAQVINGNRVHAGWVNYGLTTGTGAAYILTLAPPLPGYVDGSCFLFRAHVANTGDATLNVNGKGAIPLRKWSSGTAVPLLAGDISAQQDVQACYDATNGPRMQVQPFGGSAAGAGGGIAAMPTAADQVLISDSTTTGTWQTLPNCPDTGGNHLNYTLATNLWSCGTSGGGGGGDFSSNTSTSVDNEVVLFSGTGGKTGKRSTLTASVLKSIAGVLSAATPGTDYVLPGVDINSSHQVTATHLTAPLPLAQGGHGAAPSVDDQVFVSSSAVSGAWQTLPNCPDSGGNHLNYNIATNQWICGTSGGTVGSVAFSAITGGTNTAAAMLIGTGASLAPTGTGTITATGLSTPLAVTSGGMGAPPSTGDQVFVSDTPSTGTWRTLPNCPDAGGNHLNYDISTNQWLCGTSGGASGAPVGARYWVSQTDGTLTTEVNLGGLADGLLKHTVTGGISAPATAIPGTDYVTPGGLSTGLAGKQDTITWGAGLAATGALASTASTEAGFLTDGGATSLTCGAAQQGKMQVMDDGTLQFCDGATTSVLRSLSTSGTGGHTIQNEGTAVASQPLANLNFTGAGVDCTPDVPNNRVTCAISGTGSGVGISGTPSANQLAVWTDPTTIQGVSSISMNYAAVAVSASGTVGTGTEYVTTGAGGVTRTLPTAVSGTSTKQFHVLKVDSGVGALTLAVQTGQQLNGVTNGTVTTSTQWTGFVAYELSASGWFVEPLPGGGGSGNLTVSPGAVAGQIAAFTSPTNVQGVSTLDINFAAVHVNSTGTISTGTEYVTTGAGGVTRTLPAAASPTVTRRYLVLKEDSGVGALTIAPSGGNTLNGVTSSVSTTTQWAGFLLQEQSATGWTYVLVSPSAGTGSGDFSSNTATSVDSEVVLFSGTGGKTGKRSTLTASVVKSTGGVQSAAVAGTDYQAPLGFTAVPTTRTVCGDPLSADVTCTASDVSLGNVTNDAQLKRAANDFSSFATKTVPVTADLLLIEDSAAGGVKKAITFGSVVTGAPVVTLLNAASGSPTNVNVGTSGAHVIFDRFDISGTLTIPVPAGTPQPGQPLVLRVKPQTGTGTGLTLIGGSGGFCAAAGLALPTTTGDSSTYVSYHFMYNVSVSPNPCWVYTGGTKATAPSDVTSGGTGVATLTDHGVLIGSGTGPVDVTTPGTAGQVLTSNGAAADPTFQALPFASGLRSLYVPAAAFELPSTCTANASARLVTNGPPVTTVGCTDVDTSEVAFDFGTPDGWDGGTITLELDLVYAGTTHNTQVFAMNWSGQCVRDTDTVAAFAITSGATATSGSNVATSFTTTGTANLQRHVTSSALTLAGTCAGGAHVYVHGLVNATATTFTPLTDLKLVGVKVEYTRNAHD